MDRTIVKNMKNRIIMVIATALSLMAISCTKEQKPEEVKQMPLTITATYGEGNAKVSYTESGNAITAVWEDHDTILVVYDGYVSKLYITSGNGTASATFNGNVTYTHAPESTSVLGCYVRDAQNASALTITDHGNIIYSDAAFLNQDGTVASAGKCNTYYGMTIYGTGRDITCKFSVNTSMCKFSFHNISADQGETATLKYMSGNNILAQATFTVGNEGNTIYMAVPAGQYTDAQSLVYTCGSTEKIYTLGSRANFIAGQTYSKNVVFEETIIDLDTLGDPEYTASNGAVLTGTYNVFTQFNGIGRGVIHVDNGATIILRNATVGKDSEGIRCNGDATIILEGSNCVACGGITVPANHTLTIKGNGSLTTNGHIPNYGGNAGIGGDNSSKCGNIVINGGTITAIGGEGAAGIGAGDYRTPSNFSITINGGTITAAGGDNAAGIGCGYATQAYWGEDNCNISITGGTVTATGGTNSAGIGMSSYSSNHGLIEGTNQAEVHIDNTVTRVIAFKGSGALYSIHASQAGLSVGGVYHEIYIGGIQQTDNISDNPFVYAP